MWNGAAETLNPNPITRNPIATSASACDPVWPARRGDDRGDLRGRRGPVGHRDAVQEERRGERAQQEVLHRGLVAAPPAHPGQHVERRATGSPARGTRRSGRSRPRSGSCPPVANRTAGRTRRGRSPRRGPPRGVRRCSRTPPRARARSPRPPRTDRRPPRRRARTARPSSSTACSPSTAAPANSPTSAITRCTERLLRRANASYSIPTMPAAHSAARAAIGWSTSSGVRDRRVGRRLREVRSRAIIRRSPRSRPRRRSRRRSRDRARRARSRAPSPGRSSRSGAAGRRRSTSSSASTGTSTATSRADTSGSPRCSSRTGP